MRTNTLRLLMQLPPVFTGAQMGLLTGHDTSTVSQTLWRWSVAGIVRPLGGKSDVFLNVTVKPESIGMRANAIVLAMPEAVLAGHSILMESGISTQLCHDEYLVVPASGKRFSIQGAVVQPRPVWWMKALLNRQCIDYKPKLPRMSVSAALADLLIFDRLSAPAPDDLDFMEMSAADEEQMLSLVQLVFQDVKGRAEQAYVDIYRMRNIAPFTKNRLSVPKPGMSM